MTGDLYLGDWTGDNVGGANILAGSVVILDTANSVAPKTAVKLPTAASVDPIGVAMENTKLDNTGAVVVGTGQQVRTFGIAWCNVAAAATVNVRDRVAIGDTSGNVVTVAQTAAGSQPKPIVGVALSSCSAAAAGTQILVLLQIGQTW